MGKLKRTKIIELGGWGENHRQYIFCCLLVSLIFRVQVNSDDEAVETEDLGENEDEDHADEEAGLLGRAAHAGVADDADGVAGSEAGQADSQAGTQMNEPPGKKSWVNVTILKIILAEKGDF
jgi:hypothetical protein